MKDHPTDTIAAIATAQGEGGIGIIRLSGPDSLEIALKRFRTQETVEERRLLYGSVCGPDARRLDVGFLAYMRSPRSYTGEDVVELHCHGGPLLLRQVLSSIIDAGAKPAQPGEFTRRAFLNGKLDLSQAEAVIDLIRAQTTLSLEAARGRLEGSLSRKVSTVKAPLVRLLAHMEAELDFSDEEIDGLPVEVIAHELAEAEESVGKLLSTFTEGRALREGVKTLILGRPNAGKSSLLNVLLREERAIVTPIPGTTRDIIEEVVEIKGMPVRLMDTAGLREAKDEVEAIGVRLARGRAVDAALIIYVADLTTDLAGDKEILAGLGTDKTIVAANKADIAGGALGEAKRAFEGYEVVPISALKDEGIEVLKELIFEKACGTKAGMEAPAGELVASVRHRDCLKKCLSGLERAKEALLEARPRELLATDIREAVDALGEITGETTTEDILDVIFSSFCIGK